MDPLETPSAAIDEVFGLHVRLEGGEEWSSVMHDFRERFSEKDWVGFNPGECVPLDLKKLIETLQQKAGS